jgi:hypothetical protein
MDEACRRSLAKTCLDLAARLEDALAKEALEAKALAILDRAYDPVPPKLEHLLT